MWTGPNVAGGTTNDLYLQNINRNQAGTFYCTATNEVGSKVSSTVKVDVRCKLYIKSNLQNIILSAYLSHFVNNSRYLRIHNIFCSILSMVDNCHLYTSKVCYILVPVM
jgi:hypothetical protein